MADRADNRHYVKSASWRLRSLAAAAVELGRVDELRIFGTPIMVGGGMPYYRGVRANSD